MTSRTVSSVPKSRKHHARPREVVARAVREATSRARATARIHRHLSALVQTFPRGTHAAPVRGAETARQIAWALSRALQARADDMEGSAVQLCRSLRERGWLALPRDPAPLTAGSALALLARLTPLVVQIAHGRYRLRVLPTVSVLDDLAAADACERDGDLDVRSRRDADPQGRSDASAVAAPPQPLSALSDTHKERGRAGSSPRDDVRWIADDRRGLRAASMDRSAPAASAPHDPRLRPPRKRVGLAKAKVFSPSAWMQALTEWKHLRRAGLLCLQLLPDEGWIGDARGLAGWLARRSDGIGRRERDGLARGLQALARRGCLVVDGGTWRLPTFQPHEAVEALDVLAAPSAERPSLRMARRLERAGICPEGLGKHEALVLHRRLWSRAKDGAAPPRLVARATSALREAKVDVSIRDLGRASPRSLLRLLELAHADRIWRGMIDG